MLVDRVTDFIVQLYNNYPLVIVAFAAVALVLTWKKPKECFKFAIFLVIMFCVIYAVGLFGDTISTGSRSKEDAVRKTRDMAD